MTQDMRSQYDALQAWLAANDGEATPEQKALLSQLAVNDPAARAQFIELAEQQAWLIYHTAGNNATSPRPAAPIEHEAESSGAHGPTLTFPRTPPAAASSESGRRSFFAPLRKIFVLGSGATSRAAAVVLIVFSMGAGAMLGALVSPGSFGDPLALKYDRDDVAALMTSFEGSRWATSSVSSRWVEAAAAHDTLVIGQQLKLLAGSAQSTFGSGATVVASGAAKFSPASKSSVALEAGKFMIEVPRVSHGFEVRTPQLTAVDVETPFGNRTVFGFDITDDTVSVHVFQGIVSVQLSAPADGGQPPAPLEVSSGQGLKLAGSRWTVTQIASDATAFLPKSALGESDLLISDDYVSAIKAAAPLAYWRFEEMASNSTVGNEMATRWALRACGDVKIEEVRGNGHAVFPLSNRESWLKTGEAVSAFARDYSIELWVNSNGYQEATLVCLGPHLHQERVSSSGGIELIGADHLTFTPGSVRFLHRDAPAINGGTNVLSANRYVPRQWHHIVASKSADRMSLYIDGTLVGMEINSTHMSVDPELLIGRLHLENFSDANVRRETRQFCGQIDELAIYDRALTATEIKDHFDRAGQ